MAGSDGRRRRPAVSCTLCRKRKIRCNRETPCSNCLRSRNTACIYEDFNHSRSPQRGVGRIPSTTFGLNYRPREALPIDVASSTSESTIPSHHSRSLVAASTDASNTRNQPFIQDDESMKLKSRIQHLEYELSKYTTKSREASRVSPYLNIVTINSRMGGRPLHIHCEGVAGQPQAIARSVTHKSRLFGQSHWEVNCSLMIRDLIETLETHQSKDSQHVLSSLEKCKAIARIIKARRAPSWPLTPTPEVPSKEISDTLLDCYLRTTESVYRILHIPSFRRDYESFWISPNTSAPNMAFLVQLKLVLSIGAVTYDERFSLRASAVRWIYEAQTWLSEPKFKSRLDIQFLQTNLLLLIAQERVAVGGDSMWISIGALLRKAIHMGLHRDPLYLPKRTTFATEMRRRLWNTILELGLQSSLISGGPPLISPDDYDTAPPGNFDDDQLVTEDLVPKAESIYTQSYIAIALRKTFLDRLAVVKFLNDLSSTGTYDETLRLDTQLRTAYKSLNQNLQACRTSGSKSIPSPFEVRILDDFMLRYLSCLHLPYFNLALHQAAYAYSRKVVVDSSLKIWRAACPSSILTQSKPRNDTRPFETEDLIRLTICSSGFYPVMAIHAAIFIGVELRAQLQEEESLTPVAVRPDLLSVSSEAKAWTLQVIEAGETNIKGHILASVMAAKIDGLMSGLGEAETSDLLIKAAGEALDGCASILEKMAAAQENEKGALDGLQQASLDTPAEMTEDWSFLTSDALFSMGDDEPISWILNDNINPEMPSI